MDNHEDLGDSTLIEHYRDLYPGLDATATRRGREQLLAVAMQARARNGSFPAQSGKRHRVPDAPRFARRYVLLAVAFAALGTSVALAAPSLRHLFANGFLFSFGAGGEVRMTAAGKPVAMHPPPAFQVFYPGRIPSDLLARGVGHFRPGFWGASAFTCPGACQGFNPRTDLPITQGVLGRLAPLNLAGRIDLVWFGFRAIAPDRHYLEIGEWDVRQYPARLAGIHTGLAGQSVLLQRTPSRTFVTLVRGSTAIRVGWNGSLAELKEVIASLHRLPQT